MNFKLNEVKKAGRPANNEEKSTAKVVLYFKQSEIAILEEKAKENGSSRNAYIKKHILSLLD